MRALIAGLLLSLGPALPVQAERQAAALLAGEEATAQPWMAALLRGRHRDPWVDQFCGATLIDPEWALTAAHCLHEMDASEIARIELLVDSPVLDQDEGERIAVAAHVVHPDFVPPDDASGVEFDNDIALLRLARPVQGLPPIGLPGPEFDVMNVRPGTFTHLLGWGATVYDNDSGRATEYPRELRQARIALVAGPDCVETMGAGEVSQNMFCAGDTTGAGPDSCVRDSGGPLALPSIGPAGWMQVGIVSWGLGCALPGAYGVYTRLARYAQWISDQVCEPAEVPPRPQLTALKKGPGSVTLSWASAGQDLRYRVYYRPLLTRSPVRHIEAGEALSYTSAAPAGVPFEVAVQAYRGPCIGKFSTLRSFMLP